MQILGSKVVKHLPTRLETTHLNVFNTLVDRPRFSQRKLFGSADDAAPVYVRLFRW